MVQKNISDDGSSDFDGHDDPHSHDNHDGHDGSDDHHGHDDHKGQADKQADKDDNGDGQSHEDDHGDDHGNDHDHDDGDDEHSDKDDDDHDQNHEDDDDDDHDHDDPPLPCFTAGTLIATDVGEQPVERLAVGDLVWTLDAGLQPIRWIAQRLVTLADQRRDARLCPVVFEPGALGPGMPAQRLALSQQHRVWCSDWRAELHFGQPEVLAAAKALVNSGSVHVDPPQAAVTYVHFLLDGHQIVRSNGALSESFFPTALSLGGVDRAARAELFTLFPDLATLRHAFPQTARPVLRGQEARLVA